MYFCIVEENLSDISVILSTLCKEVDSLRQTVSVQGCEINALHRQLDLKDKQILELKHENRQLKEQLSAHTDIQKDSHNSSVPPSKEPIKAQTLKRTRSLRKKSDNPNGGQPGHEGTTLELCSSPDIIKKHAAEYCTHCGGSLMAIPQKEVGVRQVTDLPRINPVITEHRIYTRQCTCGHINAVNFPPEVRSKACYGFNIRAMISYLNTVQCVPYKRLCSMLEECFNIKLSQGTVRNILQDMKTNSNDVCQEIHSRIMNSPVVGADETGEYVNGKLHWTWVWQTDRLTYAFQSSSRGKIAIDKEFPHGLPNTTLVTDRHSSYFAMRVKDHQICLAHLLRELTYLTELDEKQTWSQRFLGLLRDAIHKRKTMEWELIPREKLFQRLDKLLKEPVEKLHRDFSRLKKSMLKHRDNIFRFFSNRNIPYDNNASERAIRIVKIKQKISGCFRSDEGADAFTQLHSIVDTAKKNEMSRYEALLAVTKL